MGWAGIAMSIQKLLEVCSHGSSNRRVVGDHVAPSLGEVGGHLAFVENLGRTSQAFMDRRASSLKVDGPSILILTSEGVGALVFDKVARGIFINLAAAALFGLAYVQWEIGLAATGVKVHFEPPGVVDTEPAYIRIVLSDTEAT